MSLPAILFDELQGLRLQLDGKQGADLAPPVFEATVHHLVRLRPEEVHGIDSAEQEHQPEHIAVFLLPLLHVHRQDLPHLLHGEGLLHGLLGLYLVFPEGIVRRELLVQGEVAYRPQVPQVDGPAVDLAADGCVEAVEPYAVDVFYI